MQPAFMPTSENSACERGGVAQKGRFIQKGKVRITGGFHNPQTGWGSGVPSRVEGHITRVQLENFSG